MAPGQGCRRNSGQAKRENSERWLLTYADLITLLLAFFVIMYGMSVADRDKFAKMSAAMRKAFNVGVLQGGMDTGIMHEQLDEAAATTSEEPEMFTSRSGDLEMIYTEMGTVLREEGLADRVSINLRPEGIAISVFGNLLFASGRAELRPDSVHLLQPLARALSRLPNQVRVEGHTDDVAPAGSDFATNWELSGARAVAVVRYLAEVEGIDPTRLSAMAMSQYRPVASNHSARTRAQNRRSEILILYPSFPTHAWVGAVGSRGATSPATP